MWRPPRHREQGSLPHAHLLFGNWINELYRITPFDLSKFARGKASIVSTYADLCRYDGAAAAGFDLLRQSFDGRISAKPGPLQQDVAVGQKCDGQLLDRALLAADWLTRFWILPNVVKGRHGCRLYLTFIAALTFSITWSIEKEAGRWRGGKSL